MRHREKQKRNVMATRGKQKAILNPQQSRFLAAYLNPASPTHGNAFKSALEAGYTEAYAKNITHEMPEWLLENTGSDRSSRMLAKAEKNLEELLDWNTSVPAIGAFGPIKDKETGEQIYKTNTEMLKIKADATKFVAERLGRAKYGQKSETEPPPSQVIHYNLFYNPQFQSTLRTAEGEIKKLIEHAEPTQEA